MLIELEVLMYENIVSRMGAILELKIQTEVLLNLT